MISSMQSKIIASDHYKNIDLGFNSKYLYCIELNNTKASKTSHLSLLTSNLIAFV